MKMLKIGLIILMVVALAGISYAQTSNLTPANQAAGDGKATSGKAKNRGPGIKAERGIKNLFLGWTEIPNSIAQVTRDSKNPIWGITGGTLKGLGKALPRTVSGASDVITAPFAGYEKSPVKPAALNTNIK